MKQALITGVTGQDGAYLAKYLLDNNYVVFGGIRRTSTSSLARLDELGITDKINFIPMDLADQISVRNAVAESSPDEVYNLAAQSYVQESFNQPLYTSDINALGFVRLIEEVRNYNDCARVYQASTSEMFGNIGGTMTEITPFKPVSPYGISKLYAHNMADHYRRAHEMHITCGILFNHESALRGKEFVTRKISDGIAQIKLGLKESLTLGNLDAYRDWGYAPEYVQGMHRMLQQDNPEDYILATNTSHSVREFVELACDHAGVSMDKVTSSSDNRRIHDIHCLKGDATKAQEDFNWIPYVSFKAIVRKMVNSDIKRYENAAKECN